MRSIRTTLTTSLVAGALLATGISGAVLHSKASSSIVRQFDETLMTRARALAALLEEERGKIDFEFLPEAWPEYMGGDAPEYFQIRVEGRGLVLRSPTLRVNGKAGDLPRGVDDDGSPVATNLRFPDGRAGRTLGLLVPLPRDGDEDQPPEAALSGAPIDVMPTSRPPTEVLVMVARTRDELDAALAALRDALLWAGCLLGATVLLVVTLAVRRGLRPLASFGDEVGRIDSRTLSRRVTDEGLPSELRPTAAKLNELLARLEAAFERERRITGNVAHELRTPIAELRAAVDVSRRWPDDVELKDAAVEAADAVSIRMREVVSGLLRLARITSGEAGLTHDEVPVRALVDELWNAFRPVAAARGLQLDHRAPPELTLSTDRTLVSVAFTNLLDNAVRFAERGSRIVCVASEGEDGRVRWSLENQTAGLHEEDLEHLAEPFWQKDASRTEKDHAGLGLTLVRSVATVLGGDVSFAMNGAFQVTLDLPHTPAPAAADPDGSLSGT